jgi:hypothetical protein
MSIRQEIKKVLEQLGLLTEFDKALSWVLQVRLGSSIGFPPYKLGDPPSVTTTATALVLLKNVTTTTEMEAKMNEDIKWLLKEQGNGKIINPKDKFAWCIANHQPSVWATAWAVWALCENGQADSGEVKKGIEYLLATQSKDTGGWPCYFGLEPRPLYTFVSLKAIATFVQKTKENNILPRINRSISEAARFLTNADTTKYSNMTEVLLMYAGLTLINSLVKQGKLNRYHGPNLRIAISKTKSQCNDFLRRNLKAYSTPTPIFEPLPVAAGWSVWPFHPAAISILWCLKKDAAEPIFIRTLEWFQRNWININKKFGGWPDLQSKNPYVYTTLLSLIALHELANEMSKVKGWRYNAILALIQEVEELKKRLKMTQRKHRIFWILVPLFTFVGFLIGHYSSLVYNLLFRVLEFVQLHQIEIGGLIFIISLILKGKDIYNHIRKLIRKIR